MIESSSQSFIFYTFILYEILQFKKKKERKEKKKKNLPCIYFVSIMIYWPNLHIY